MWNDADVRWLTGTHEAGDFTYFVSEPYEELMWWLLMPSLLRLASEAAPNRVAAQRMSRTVQEALDAAAKSNYRLETLLESNEPTPKHSANVVGTEPAVSLDETKSEFTAVNPEAMSEANVVEEEPVKPHK